MEAVARERIAELPETWPHAELLYDRLLPADALLLWPTSAHSTLKKAGTCYSNDACRGPCERAWCDTVYPDVSGPFSGRARCAAHYAEHDGYVAVTLRVTSQQC